MARLNWRLLLSAQCAIALTICSFCGIAALADGATVPGLPPPADVLAPLGMAEEEFLRIGPLPDGIEKVGPIQGAVNVPFAECEASWPEGYKADRKSVV